MAKILMGSTYFFSQYPDFESKDIDEIEIVETTKFNYMSHLIGNNKCSFLIKKQPTTQKYIDDALKCHLGMTVGKFLIPEFASAIELNIEDLPQLQPLIDRLDEKHQYEKIIYNSYIANNDFILTDVQRDIAYKLYKESRGIK